MRHCMVPFCPNRGNVAGVRYFRLTADRRDRWLSALGRQTTEEVSLESSICSNHFLEEDFKEGKQKLKADAVPTLNLRPVRRQLFSRQLSPRYWKFLYVIMGKPRLLLLSSSAVHGHGYLEYAADDINEFLKESKVSSILFIPYASVDHDAYLAKIGKIFTKWGYQVEGIHKDDPVVAVKRAEAIFIGGGNTFLLLRTLYEKNLIEVIRKRVVNEGVPYIGSSAGTNVAAKTIHNTNDMPIVYPPSFNALQLIPFNINPHFLDRDSKSTHKGETREERILQYHELPGAVYPTYNVLGLREGATLLVDGDTATLKGIKGARLFEKGKAPQELEVGADLSYLLKVPLEAATTDCKKITAAL